MPLHRDIFWVGRQWAVTGLGLQAVDQKQKSAFDVEIARLWDEDLAGGLSAERWFNAEDFSKGLSIARARYPDVSSSTKDVSPQPFESKTEPNPLPVFEAVPPREPLLPVRKLAPAAPPARSPQVEPSKPAAAPAEPSHDTWASLAELARTARAAPSRKVLRPEPVAPPPEMLTAVAEPAPRREGPDFVASIAEPSKHACLPSSLRIERSGAQFCRMWRVRIRG
jgi:hypothetical protein